MTPARPTSTAIIARPFAASARAAGGSLSLSNESHLLRNSGHAVKREDGLRCKSARKQMFFVGFAWHMPCSSAHGLVAVPQRFRASVEQAVGV